jgi:glucosamine-6-phosphate deaminase
MRVCIRSDADQVARAAAQDVARLLNSKPNAVLGLATGSTPLGLYRELIRMHREDGLDFSKVTTFNLDEYVGLTPQDPRSYHHFMYHNLLDHLNISPQNIYIPSGTTDNYEQYCLWYEQRIVECGGIDLQILGIGSDGHIAFNEPSSSLGSRTRIKTLARQTIQDNARFFDHPDDVPIYAVTMGVGTILEARSILLLAHGEAKAAAIAAAIEGPVTSMITASALQLHRDVTSYLDCAAASRLTMIEYYEWIEQQEPRAPPSVPSPHFRRRTSPSSSESPTAAGRRRRAT